MRIDVLGTVRARNDDGSPVALGGPRHREVLARLVAAEGRMVGTDTLVGDLWPDPPARAVGALRTFVAALRRALEPDRPPRHPPRLLVTEGPGYALRLPRADVDAQRFEDALTAARRDPAAPDAAAALTTALATWRGPAYADVPASPWADRERTRLEELRLEAVELRARILLDTPPGPGAEPSTWPASSTETRDVPGPDGAPASREAATTAAQRHPPRGTEDVGRDPAGHGTGAADGTDTGDRDETPAAPNRHPHQADPDRARHIAPHGTGAADGTNTTASERNEPPAAPNRRPHQADPDRARTGAADGTNTTTGHADGAQGARSGTGTGAPDRACRTAGTGSEDADAADPREGLRDAPDMAGPQGSPSAEGEAYGAGSGVAALVAELGAHVAAHPWREPAWGLLARALHRAGRQADALATLRRAREMLADRLGLDPGPALRRVEAEILGADAPAGWAAPGVRLGPRTTVDLARTLAFAGGEALVASRRDRLAAIRAAERTGDPGLTARVIGAYDVPALWSRADDPAQSRAVVAAAERTLAALGSAAPAPVRARLLATVAVESRSAGLSAAERGRAGRAARRAEALAREADDPALLAFALNGTFLQSFTRPGLAGPRDGIGAEILALAGGHDLPGFAVLGRLVRLQSASALGDLDAAAGHAEAAERLAAVTEAPLVPVLTGWFRARAAAARSAGRGGPSAAEAASRYREAEAALRTAGMPGLHRGLFALALLGLRLLHDRPAPTDPRLDWGPYLPWARPLVLLAQDRADQARTALTALPEPPRDHVQEALWCLTARAAVRLGEPGTAARAARALRDARTEDAGAASGMLTLGPVAGYLAEAEAAA
ncbi:BTAD domain-containing putative transcriptional regulator [Streptomyces sp. NPDC021224]|uniref:BTAD domain-containing putative transcriptional regulator n=1 Tax=unclassified Streptomyces TaxID=2593676 RepID=UPI0037873515